MRRDHRAGIDHGVANRLGVFTLAGVNPNRIQPKRRILAGLTGYFAEHIAWVNGHFFAIGNHTHAAHRPINDNLVRIWSAIEIVANTD